MIPLSVRSVGMIASVGDGALECAASVRAGVARVAETSILSRGLAPLRMALVPAGSLPALSILDAAPRGTRHRRVLRLAHAALREAFAALDAPALPVSVVTSARDHGPTVLDDLAQLPGLAIDRARSVHVGAGAAGVFLALRDAAHRISRGEADAVAVVCADSLLDPVRLDALQRARRLLVDDVTDGFLPGEGACALVVRAAGDGGLATIPMACVEPDGFTPEGELPLTGDGLSRAIQGASEGASAPASEVWAGLNGEAWTAREWGVAARRARRALRADATLAHPVECFGDPGAALGGMLLTLAVVAAARGLSRGCSLAWASSEDGLRGAARVERVS